MFNTSRNRFILLALSCYFILALAWIFLSDRVLILLTDQDTIVELSTLKGIFFVCTSSVVLFFVLRAVPSELQINQQPSTDNLLFSSIIFGNQSRWLIYGFAVIISSIMVIIRLYIPVDITTRPLMIFFMLPIILSALIGGIGPGLVSTLISALGIAIFANPPLYSLVTPTYVQLQWAFLVVNGFAVSILSALLHRAITKQMFDRHFLDSIISGTSDAVFIKDSNGKYILANTAAADFVGKTPTQLLGESDFSLFTEESALELKAKDQEIMNSHHVHTHVEQLVAKNGNKYTFLVTKGPVFDLHGNVFGLFGISRDISELQKISIQLKNSEERLNLVIDAISDGVWDWDVKTGHVYRSPRYYEVIDALPEQDTHDFSFFEKLIHPCDYQYVIQSINDHLNGKSSSIDISFRLITLSGHNKNVRVNGKVVGRNEQNKPIRVIGSLTDITEHEKLLDEHRLIIHEAGDAIWIADSKRHIIFANPAACELSGYPFDKISKLLVDDLTPEQSRNNIIPFFARLDSEIHVRDEWPLLKSDGSILTVELTAVKMQDGRYMAFGRDRTEQILAMQQLAENEQKLERVIEGSDQGYWDWNLQTNQFQVSARWETMLGYEPGEMDVSLEHWPDIVHPDDLKVAMTSIQQHLNGLIPTHSVELRCRTKSGGWRWIYSTGRVVKWDENGNPLIMSGTHTDITDRKIFQKMQKESSIVFDNSEEGIILINAAKNITKVNAAFTHITGYTPEDVIGKSVKMIASEHYSHPFYTDMWASLHQHDFWRGELWNRRKNEELYAILLSMSIIRDAQGKIEYYVGVFSDITQLKTHEHELDRVANYDSLTGLPNRRLLSDRLQQAINRSARKNTSCAVCVFDLDGFKSINDRYGHTIGDLLLVGIADNLKMVLRPDDTLARLGGDEFVILLPEISSQDDCIIILERILSAINQNVQCKDNMILASASMGVSLYPDDNADPDTLLRHADQAMYQAKEAGKNRYQLFDPEKDLTAQRHRNQLEILHAALMQNEFTLYYQPKVNFSSSTITGAEALIRWQHPERGIIPPSEFLPHIHSSNLEIVFGEWVINSAIAQAEVWHQEGLKISISINVSANHLLKPGFHDFLRTTLIKHPNVPPSYIELEILESAAITDLEQAVSILHECRKLGIHFALDDFGTGYSSLTYLRRLPVDTLKIDQSFVRDMLEDSEDLSIVRSVIQLASVFGKQVIAEGVESLAHCYKLEQLGCSNVQGYGIAKPMNATVLPEWCKTWPQTASLHKN